MTADAMPTANEAIHMSATGLKWHTSVEGQLQLGWMKRTADYVLVGCGYQSTLHRMGMGMEIKQRSRSDHHTWRWGIWLHLGTGRFTDR
jgi:hypothetical protein